MSEYRNIAVALLDESATNPRKSYNSEGLAGLAESLKTVGVIQPLVVRAKKKRFEIIAGSRRYRAAKIAGLKEVPCSVRELTDEQVLEIQLIENLQRADVHPIEEADGYRLLIDKAGYDVAKIAVKIGKSESYVYQRLELAQMIPAAQKAFRAKEITPSHAIHIARCPAKDQSNALGVARKGMPIRQFREWIQRVVHRRLDKGGFDLTDADLLKGAPACVDCPKRSGNAKALFDDISSGDVCTDHGCYERKQEAHIKQTLADGNKAGAPLVQIETEYRYQGDRPKDVLAAGAYTKLDNKAKSCSSAKLALVVHGPGFGKTMQVCADPKCKVHGKRNAEANPYRRSEADIAKDRREKQELELARRVRGAVVDALLDAMPKEPILSSLEDWAEAWWSDLSGESKHMVRKRHAWDADTIPIGDLDLPGLMRFLNEMLLSRELYVSQWTREKGVSKELQERAEAAGVDWKAIEATVRNEAAKPKGKAAKPETPKPPKAKGKKAAKEDAPEAKAKAPKPEETEAPSGIAGLINAYHAARKVRDERKAQKNRKKDKAERDQLQAAFEAAGTALQEALAELGIRPYVEVILMWNGDPLKVRIEGTTSCELRIHDGIPQVLARVSGLDQYFEGWKGPKDRLWANISDITPILEEASLVTCPFCNAEMTRGELAAHEADCLEAARPTPSEDVDAAPAEETPADSMIQCPHSDCEVWMPKGSEEAHEREKHGEATK